MTYTPQQIYDALKVIKTTCSEQDCENCPFSVQSDCMITGPYQPTPCEWELNLPKNWVAFH